MHAQLMKLKIGGEMRSAAEKMVEQSYPNIKKLKGFKGVTFFGDVGSGDYFSLSLWESKEDAEAAIKATGPVLEQAVKGIAKAPPTRQIYEVYEPKA